MKIKIVFTECEHAGDLRNYEDELYDCGAKILDSQCNLSGEDDETGYVVIQVDDVNDFNAKWKESDSFGFGNYLR